MRTLIFIFILLPFTLLSQVIPTNYVMAWVPNVTVGVVGGMNTNRNSLINVTNSPYFADNSGRTDATAAIQSAVDAATSNQVIYFPAGHYAVSNILILHKQYVTYRGESPTNTFIILSWPFALGEGASNYQLNPTDWATNSGMNGTYTLTLTNSTTIAKGDLIRIDAYVTGDDLMQVIALGIPLFRVSFYDTVASISGQTVTLNNPFPYDLTNNTTIYKMNPTTYHGIGLENLTFTETNEVTHDVGHAVYVVQFGCSANSWVYNCNINWAYNYSLVLFETCNIQVEHCNINHVQGSGSNHSGLLTSGSFCLVEDTIFSDGLQPAIEFNGGSCGSAFFGNFFTNNLTDIDDHGFHPIMNLWEGNVQGTYVVITDGGLTTNAYGGGFELDGYFSSCSHQTLFRNNISSPYQPVELKRWSSYCSIVGNVLGSDIAISPGGYSSFLDNGAQPGRPVIELGRPNIGNSTYTGTNPPIPWNYPGAWVTLGSMPNGFMVFTNNQTGTNLLGNFTNVTTVGSIIFQDGINTNAYYPREGGANPIVQATFNGTATNVFINRSITVSNGWRVFFIVQSSDNYQQRITTNISTHIITGNYDYFNHSQTWDSAGATNIPLSLIYTNGAPSWWGANRWPAVQPDSATLVTAIPAQLRYTGTFDTNIYVTITAVNCMVNGSVGAVSVPTNSVATIQTNAVNFLNYSITGGSLSNANAAVTFLTASNSMTVTGNYSAPTPPAGNVTTVGRIYF